MMQTKPVDPLWTLDLDQGAMSVAAAREVQRVAIALEAPIVRVAQPGKSTVQNIELTEPASRIAISTTGNVLAVVSASRGLKVFSLHDNMFGRELNRWDIASFDDCAFSHDGKLLWTVGAISDDITEINCFDLGTNEMIGRHRFQPLIGGCGFVLTVHPQVDTVGLWACGGPDELWNYFVRLTANGVEFQHQPELDGCTPPCFNSRGDQFAVLDGYDLLAFSFSTFERLYSPMNPLDDDNVWAESMAFLDSNTKDRVLASTNEARLFMVGLADGEVIGEIALAGHEPKPCYQVYTSLSRTEENLCTDLRNFTSVGNNLILSVHSNGRASNRRDTLLLWRAPVDVSDPV